MRTFLLIALMSPLALACGKKEPTNPRGCAQFGVAFAGGSTEHVPDCSSTRCGNGLNPPTAGPHCPITLPCRKYDAAQARCQWIHNLEHGHAVLAYNCPNGCPEVVSELEAIWKEKPRRILVPDPALPKRVAAIVWGYAYSSDEVNVDAIRCVLDKQDQDAPEAGLGCAP